jgi:hypothetical protein
MGVGAFALATMGTVSVEPSSRGDILASNVTLGISGTPAEARRGERGERGRRRGPVFEAPEFEFDFSADDDDDGPDDGDDDDDGPEIIIGPADDDD